MNKRKMTGAIAVANLYTKTGDKGQTSLFGGNRVKKDSLKVESYGTLDEANSMLGLAYSQITDEKIKEYIDKIQRKIFSVGAELASDDRGFKMLKDSDKVTEEDVTDLEKIIDECTEIVGVQTYFVIPGVNLSSSALHVARTIVRRAERCVVKLKRTEDVRPEVVKYINRLSDTIYALARLEEYRSSNTEDNRKL
ncbi:cob(I)yrinic acid a,c-diamide adenosyltransferase [Metaclostridioides mangenotii]|uniref:cob(I)yrinic acid a,c-diamide adenosyltransferase n=1 Tax=Metaclostridioides mangenotii TaxID=1540 RepID=UPI000A5DA959|nr:cob(I)yrinic acid a,c-diamide adenosyltransferase [Clostridioides mangenotii]